MRKKQLPQIPTALACGLLEDRQRALFLVKLDNAGMERLEIPCVEIMPGDNPVSALTTAFRTQTGIDAQVHEILFQKRHNVGSNKRKVWIPALVFKITATAGWRLNRFPGKSCQGKASG
ncbi:MAG: hypothetical protein NT051_03690 [Candidatus Micrarchaeota archaeon]|nr:hypothetical protein [Candidatus Micrarchaeota archaeon]